MIQSHVIEIDGIFAGVAVLIGPDYRFIAIDPRLEDLDRTHWPTLAEVRRVADKVMHPATPASPRGPNQGLI